MLHSETFLPNQDQARSNLEIPFNGLVAGVDEVGRGALFGPVVAAAVILPEAIIPDLIKAGVRDSKQLNIAQRVTLASQIRQVAIDAQIGTASVREIDRLNILRASLLAMKRAILKLKLPPALCLIDGNQKVPSLTMLQQTVIKGDQTEPAIAAASIIAKVWRDELIIRLSLKHPVYDLASNKGYGSPKHQAALQRYGPCPLHRLSFQPCRVNKVLR